jgi:Tfp pilus assembly protein PilV
MKRPAFTFLELLVSLTLFVVGMLSVLQIFPVNRRFLQQSAQNTQATFLAQEEVENIRSLTYDTITTGTFEASHALGSGTSDPLNQFTRQTVVTLVSPESTPTAYATSATDLGMKRVDVTVSWKERTIARTYVLSTYVYKK